MMLSVCGKPYTDAIPASFEKGTTVKFVKLRQVTLPALKLVKGTPRYIKTVRAMYLGEKIDGDVDRKAATLLHSIDLETGEEGVVICPSVLVSELNRNYPGDSYVGRCFEVIISRRPEKEYNDVSLAEIEAPVSAEVVSFAEEAPDDAPVGKRAGNRRGGFAR